jgi:hypothetical protein
MQTINPLLSLSPSQLRRAAELKERIESLNDELAGILSGTQSDGTSDTPQTRGRGGRRKMSAAGRARIAAAVKARWARIRAEKGGADASASNGSDNVKPKRTMSPAARKKIAAAARARWARVKAAKG